MLHIESPPHHQGIYAPLSQSGFTDSESEEEIHNSSKHCIKQSNKLLQQQQQQKLNQQTLRNPPKTLALTLNSELNSNNRYLRQKKQYIKSLQTQQRISNTHLANGVGSTNNQPSSYTTNMQNTFRSVMMSGFSLNTDTTHCNPGSNFSSFSSDYEERNHIDADNVAILGGSGDEKNTLCEPMSSARRCCFILSLALCLFAVIGFVWLVPCGDKSNCPALIDRIKTHNWLNNYTTIELKCGVHVVNGKRSWQRNLIFLYRGDAFFPMKYNSAAAARANNAVGVKRNGVISLVGATGVVAWYEEMTDEPVAIDCTLLDVNGDGKGTDCLVLDEYGELGAIDALNGNWHWRFKERSAFKVSALDFPLILPDVDGDGVLDILIISSVSLAERTRAFMKKEAQQQNAQPPLNERNLLRILSGRLGKPIGEAYKVHDCVVLSQLQLEQAQNVSFKCLRNGITTVRSKTLANIFALITNKSKLGGALSKLAQHHHFGNTQRNIYSLSGRELLLENRGKCPDNCNVTVKLTEVRRGKLTVLQNFTNADMYGMVPVQWHFKSTKTKMSGFVMKFWKWNSVIRGQQQQRQHGNVPLTPTLSTIFDGNYMAKTAYNKKFKANTPKLSNSNNNNNNNSNSNSNKSNNSHRNNMASHLHGKSNMNTDYLFLLDKERLTRSATFNINGSKQIYRLDERLHLDAYRMQMITETVLLVLFVGNETRFENTSQSSIVQFCRRDRSEMICQPDLMNQENSMLIADLDEDGSQELVSYMSTYYQASEDAHDWKLATNVRLLRLESELPQYYDQIKKA